MSGTTFFVEPDHYHQFFYLKNIIKIGFKRVRVYLDTYARRVRDSISQRFRYGFCAPDSDNSELPKKKNTLIIFVFIKDPYLYGRAEQFRESRSKNIIGIMKSHCVREYNNIKRTHTFRRFFQITTLSFRTNSKIDPEIGRPRQFKRQA